MYRDNLQTPGAVDQVVWRRACRAIDVASDLFGSDRRLAAALGIQRQAVSIWRRKGRMPLRQAMRVIALARRRDQKLTLADLGWAEFEKRHNGEGDDASACG